MANQQPVSLQGQSNQELFPTMATSDKIANWIPNTAVPPNPLFQVWPGAGTYTFNDTVTYAWDITPPFDMRTGSWPDGAEFTRDREHMYWIVHHGGADAFNDINNMRSVSMSLPYGVTMANGQPNTNHWCHGDEADVRPWQDKIRNLLQTLDKDSRGYMVKEAKKFWDEIQPQPGDHWHQSALVPGRLVSIMLYYIRTAHPNHRPGMVAWLLGSRLSPHLDINALYASWYWNITYPCDALPFPDPVTQFMPRKDLIPILVDWLELSCAHMLTEVFKNHYAIKPATGASRKMLRENFKYIAQRYPDRYFLELNVNRFPWRG